ncbi:MAG: MotA/TolQ/ExbB proton channel family protein [candidate division NC10 bacterium]|nr:MotA/TolQ/ExbB proton channel family protein [candidate division NC10 bacterium]
MNRKTWAALILAGGLLIFARHASWAADPPVAVSPEVTQGLIRGKGDTLLSLYLKGGPVMHVITLCSILALAVVLERLISLRKGRIISPTFLEEIRRHWYRREVQEAMAVCKEHNIALSRILRAGLLRFDLGLEEIERAIEDAGRREATLLNKNLGLLNFLSQMAPLLGLFGTVLGMTQSFDAIARYGREGNIELVASGIAVALLTTVWGLMVGIPALGAYYYLRRKIELRVFEMEEVVVRLLEDLSSQREGRPVVKEVPKEEREEIREPIPVEEPHKERVFGGVRSYERPL